MYIRIGWQQLVIKISFIEKEMIGDTCDLTEHPFAAPISKFFINIPDLIL